MKHEFEQLTQAELDVLHSMVRHDLDARHPHPDEGVAHSLKSKLEDELRRRRSDPIKKIAESLGPEFVMIERVGRNLVKKLLDV